MIVPKSVAVQVIVIANLNSCNSYEYNSILGGTSVMCVLCAGFSALTLFTPVTEAPQSTNVTPANIPHVRYEQIKSKKVAQEARIAIAGMLNQLPSSPETRILREEFKSMQAQLAMVNDDTKAEAIIYSGLDSLVNRIMAEPNSDQIIDTLMKMLEVKDNQQGANGLKLNTDRSTSSGSASLTVQGSNWGWLY